MASLSGAMDAAFAGDLGGDALIDLRRQVRVHQDGQFRLAQHVDESGRDHHAVRIDGALRGRAFQVADGGDLAGANGDIAAYQGEPVPSTMWPLRITTS